MASLIALSYIAKSAVSKVYEYDKKKHKLKRGDNLVVTGRGKPKLVMTKDEYAEHQLNRHKREYREGASKRGYITSDIDPNYNPQAAKMLRNEALTGKVAPNRGNWNQGTTSVKLKRSKVPLHDSRATSSLYDTDLTRSHRSFLSSYNKKTNFKPKNGSMAEVLNKPSHRVRGVHYGDKPKINAGYKGHYTQNMVNTFVNEPIKNLQEKQKYSSNPAAIDRQIAQYRKRAKEFQDYARDNGHDLKVL